MKKIIILTTMLFIATFVYAETYTVEKVIDGGTLQLSNGEIIRLIGIDVPANEPSEKAKQDAERTGQDLETIVKMGEEATRFVKTFIMMKEGGLEGKKVRLEFDVQEKDQYDHLLAYVYYTSYTPSAIALPTWMRWVDEDKLMAEIMLNAEIIYRGYATPMTVPPNVKYAQLFEELYQEAKENRRGLWKLFRPTETEIRQGVAEALIEAGIEREIVMPHVKQGKNLLEQAPLFFG